MMVQRRAVLFGVSLLLLGCGGEVDPAPEEAAIQPVATPPEALAFVRRATSEARQQVASRYQDDMRAMVNALYDEVLEYEGDLTHERWEASRRLILSEIDTDGPSKVPESISSMAHSVSESKSSTSGAIAAFSSATKSFRETAEYYNKELAGLDDIEAAAVQWIGAGRSPDLVIHVVPTVLSGTIRPDDADIILQSTSTPEEVDEAVKTVVLGR